MATDIDTKENASSAAEPTTCTLDFPLTGRLPGFLSLATIPGAVLVNPLFFGLAGGLLAIISLLLSPPRRRRIGVFAFIGALIAGTAGYFLTR